MPRLRVLDAGCGRKLPQFALGGAVSPLSLEGAHVTGLDVDEGALASNHRLDERIVGSVEMYPLPPEAFDVVVCWDVLEHLSRPSLAIENLARALKPAGVMFLGFPNVFSFKGIVTSHAVPVPPLGVQARLSERSPALPDGVAARNASRRDSPNGWRRTASASSSVRGQPHFRLAQRVPALS